MILPKLIIIRVGPKVTRKPKLCNHNYYQSMYRNACHRFLPNKILLYSMSKQVRSSMLQEIKPFPRFGRSQILIRQSIIRRGGHALTITINPSPFPSGAPRNNAARNARELWLLRGALRDAGAYKRFRFLPRLYVGGWKKNLFPLPLTLSLSLLRELNFADFFSRLSGSSPLSAGAGDMIAMGIGLLRCLIKSERLIPRWCCVIRGG